MSINKLSYKCGSPKSLNILALPECAENVISSLITEGTFNDVSLSLLIHFDKQ